MRGLHKTDIEQIMEDGLKKLNINLTPQFPIRGSYILDFANPKLKICVECDGEAWHPEGNHYDRKKNYFLTNRGWIVLRFKGEEIKTDINKCLNKINEVIERRLKDDKDKS